MWCCFTCHSRCCAKETLVVLDNGSKKLVFTCGKVIADWFAEIWNAAFIYCVSCVFLYNGCSTNFTLFMASGIPYILDFLGNLLLTEFVPIQVDSNRHCGEIQFDLVSLYEVKSKHCRSNETVHYKELLYHFHISNLHRDLYII